MERVEALSGQISVVCSDDHNFGTDALLLAGFAAPRPEDKVMDLGCGCGIIPLFLLSRGHRGPVYGVDISPAAVELCRKSISLSEGCGNFIPLRMDLKTPDPELGLSTFDVVISNPPYKPAGTGMASPNRLRAAARHEIFCNLEDVCAAAGSLLRSGGRFCLCHRPQRLADVLESMRKHKIEPKRLQFVRQRPGTAPFLLLAEGRRDGGKGLAVLEDLVLSQRPDLKKCYGPSRQENA